MNSPHLSVAATRGHIASDSVLSNLFTTANVGGYLRQTSIPSCSLIDPSSNSARWFPTWSQFWQFRSNLSDLLKFACPLRNLAPGAVMSLMVPRWDEAWE